MGLYRSSGVYCTQCEAEGFSAHHLFPRPAGHPFNLHGADRGFARRGAALLSNGNPVEAGSLGEDRHYAVWFDPFPKPSYLFALVAGDLGVVTDSFTTMSGRSVALAIYVEHGKEKLATYAMDALKRSMRWDEEAFAREYDLDVFNIVAVSDFNMGAMENKGLNVFNDKYVLADQETATDADFANIEAIIAHEYFHNWTGNRITCRDWFQLCLKEGLTVFRDHEFSADQRSRAVKRIAEVRTLRRTSSPRTRGRWPIPCGRAATARSTTSTRRPSTKGLGSGAHDPHHPRPRGVPRRHGPLFPAARRAGRDDRGFHPGVRGRFRQRSLAVRALVSSGRHAERHGGNHP